MNKYELALVVSAKLEDEARDAVVEKAKSYITRYNGVITEVEEWGKKKLAYEIQKMHEGFYYFIQFEADSQCSVPGGDRETCPHHGQCIKIPGCQERGIIFAADFSKTPLRTCSVK